ncbi:MAG: NAD(P)-binding protein [Planctomycetales bacterium]|nr:NAD(P)-binding protein [Planctomycetales bacterium]MBN8629009.1 NAD(P)-binding protein [Planctomycetota bacterium]
MFNIDYLIVGSGLTGAVIARMLHDAGREVLVLDRRSHWGGNVHDTTHESGISVHTYGPHYFRTSSARIWDFARRFGEFYKYEAALLADLLDERAAWPIGASYIRRVIGTDWHPEFSGTPLNFEEAALAIMPRKVYETFVKEYNEKQWGVPADTLAASLCGRFEVRHDDEPRLKPACPYQGLPLHGYAAWMRGMLQGIPLLLNYDYLAHRRRWQPRKCLVFTGPIDEFFSFELGRLAYRGQRRSHSYLPDVKHFAQPTGQVNNPLHAGGNHIRTLEWKHMMRPDLAAKIQGTVLTTETPYSPSNPTDFEYPFPDDANAQLYQRYRLRAESLERTLICGRLGEYRYYDMDQAIGRAITLAERLLEQLP